MGGMEISVSLKIWSKELISGRDIYDQPNAGFSGKTVGYGMNFESVNATYPAVTHTALICFWCLYTLYLETYIFLNNTILFNLI